MIKNNQRKYWDKRGFLNQFFLKGEEGHVTYPYYLDKPIPNYNFEVGKINILTKDDNIPKQIMDFINRENCTGTGNITMMNNNIFSRLKNNSIRIGILSEKDIIIGTIISLGMTCEHDNNKFRTSYTTYLCIDKKFRQQGLCIYLIQEMLKHGVNNNIYHGYFLRHNSPDPENIPIKSWLRIINIQQAKTAGFTFPNYRQNNDHSDIRNRMKNHIPKPSKNAIKMKDSDYDLVMKYGDNKWRLFPDINEWGDFCNFFDVFYVPEEGIFALFPLLLKIGKTNQIIEGMQLVCCWGKGETILPSALYLAKEAKSCILCGYYTGNINKDAVELIHGMETLANNTLHTYNSTVIMTPEDMGLPLF